MNAGDEKALTEEALAGKDWRKWREYRDAWMEIATRANKDRSRWYERALAAEAELRRIKGEQ